MATNIQKGIIGLTIFTALVHLFLALVSDTSESPILALLFALNFLGYILLLLAIFYLSTYYGSRTMFGISLMVYAFITIIAYVVVRYQGSIGDLVSPLGIITKLAEISIIVLVYLDLRTREGTE